MIYRIVVAIFLSLIAASVPPTVVATTEPKNKGLFISPLRQETTIAAGKSQSGFFTVANLTETPMTVNLSVKQFSVTDYAYNYEFRPPENDWIKVKDTQAQLQPNQSKKIQYDISVPANIAPGGYYYTLFASTNIVGGSLSSTVQATNLLYLTVEGKLVRTSVLEKASNPFLVMDSEVSYKFDVKDIGNVHFSAYFFGQLEGLFGKYPENGTSHLLMPGAVRTIEGSIPTPLLPGIYKLTYGYKVDFADFITTKTAYIIFIPPWSIVALALLLISGRWLWQRKRKKTDEKASA
jgi:hypothetical protein